MFRNAERGNFCYNCFQEKFQEIGPCPHCGFDLEENEKKYPVALRAGTVLNNRYIIGRVLGQGGFGITYLAYDTKLAAKVAVKEFMPNEIATRIGTTVSVAMESRMEDFTYGAERFQEEARTLAKFMGQPGIAGVTDYFDENDTSYFVMDYIEGISFKTYIANQGGKVSVEDALNVMIPVLRALTAVHAEGFIHRDVTPDNIYITRDGNVKLLDFGSARYSIGDKSKSLDVILKVGYAPKEQYIRRGRQGPYTDVYSCAACLYAAMTGYLPPESLERLDQDTLVPPSQAGVELPLYLERAILKGLAVQPEDRFQTAAEFLEAIESQQVVELTTAKGQGVLPSEKKKVSRPVIFGIGAAALALVVGVSLFGGGGRGAVPVGEGSGNSTPLVEAEVPSITIAGETYGTDLRKLDLSGRGLGSEDLSELHYMVNVTDLRLDDNQVTDLTPISGMTQLKSLRLENNGLEDLSPLAGLTNLEYLNLRKNTGIGDLSALRGMTKLGELQLPAQNQIADLSPLAGLVNLEYLSFSDSGSNIGSGISDLSPLSGLTKLTNLRMTVGSVEDLSPLSGLTNLQTLDLRGSMNITDLSPLSGLTKLQELHLKRSGSGSNCVFVKNLDALSNLTELTSLSLDCAGLEDVNGLKNMGKLTSLWLYGDSALQDFSGISGLTSLKELQIYNNGSTNPYLKDLSFLSDLTQLETLDLGADGLESLKGLENLTKLNDLNFWGNDGIYSDVAPISGLTNLKTLRLPGRNYEIAPLDISGLSNLTQLEELEIYSGVSSFAPISGLTKLKVLHFYGSYNIDQVGADDLSAFSHLTNLTELRLTLAHNVADITPLRELTNLRSLDISSTGNWQQPDSGLKDLSPLGKLTNLQSLTLNLGSPVTDLSPLRNLTNLQTADIRCYNQAKVTDWSPVEHVPNLTYEGNN